METQRELTFFAGLNLSKADVEAIVHLVAAGVHVNRTIMRGEDFSSTSWSFSDNAPIADDELIEEPAP